MLLRDLPGICPRLDERKSIIWGKHVTGHALEYDYKDGTGFVLSGNLNFGPPFYPLELILRDAVGPNGQYHGGVDALYPPFSIIPS